MSRGRPHRIAALAQETKWVARSRTVAVCQHLVPVAAKQFPRGKVFVGEACSLEPSINTRRSTVNYGLSRTTPREDRLLDVEGLPRGSREAFRREHPTASMETGLSDLVNRLCDKLGLSAKADSGVT
jgi:hypothetical protein